eukprot:TRINITY_DN8927_c0_g4_i1.p1 TRINITY_DN8927_c0_g4~~TRINITY_DN8927_c0_g4_i1.p1  ORF type:complete len:478 (+),score=44.83 TRINITY_DN8927_c0_g4_i1:56-1489(+)
MADEPLPPISIFRKAFNEVAFPRDTCTYSTVTFGDICSDAHKRNLEAWGRRTNNLDSRKIYTDLWLRTIIFFYEHIGSNKRQYKSEIARLYGNGQDFSRVKEHANCRKARITVQMTFPDIEMAVAVAEKMESSGQQEKLQTKLGVTPVKEAFLQATRQKDAGPVRRQPSLPGGANCFNRALQNACRRSNVEQFQEIQFRQGDGTKILGIVISLDIYNQTSRSWRYSNQPGRSLRHCFALKLASAPEDDSIELAPERYMCKHLYALDTISRSTSARQATYWNELTRQFDCTPAQISSNILEWLGVRHPHDHVKRWQREDTAMGLELGRKIDRPYCSCQVAMPAGLAIGVPLTSSPVGQIAQLPDDPELPNLLLVKFETRTDGRRSLATPLWYRSFEMREYAEKLLRADEAHARTCCDAFKLRIDQSLYVTETGGPAESDDVQDEVLDAEAEAAALLNSVIGSDEEEWQTVPAKSGRRP